MVSTPFGLFKYKYISFGLENAGATYQRFTDSILVNTKNCFSYLDDILIESETIEESITQVEQVLSLHADHN